MITKEDLRKYWTEKEIFEYSRKIQYYFIIDIAVELGMDREKITKHVFTAVELRKLIIQYIREQRSLIKEFKAKAESLQREVDKKAQTLFDFIDDIKGKLP